jgi:cellobiose-specific phosphotransferase system component IIB
MAEASIDNLATKRSLIDLSAHSDGDFDLSKEFILSFVYDDIILVEYIDEAPDNSGDNIMRDGIYIPTNTLSKTWRKAKVILAGPECKYTKTGDIVMFPNDKGASVANIQIADYGTINKGMFLNEQRLFGICKRREDITDSNGKN